MKDCKPSFSRLLWGGMIAFTLLLRAAFGQGTSPSGTYGFVANAYQIDSVGSNGGALMGLMNFDGAGNVNGTVTLTNRNPQPGHAFTGAGNFTGTYSSNPDGTFSVQLAFNFGFAVTFDMVVTDGGQGLQFVSTDTFGGLNATFQGSAPQSLKGSLPIKLFFASAFGGIPISLTGVTPAGGGPTVYTAAPATGSGSANCPDGSTGTWSASLSNLTIVANGGGFVSGNFLAAAIGTVCGNPDFETLSGLVTGTVDTAGATTLNLQGSGFVVSGLARVATAGGSLNGSYGVQLNSSPFPAGAVGLMQFDGAGNVTASLTFSGVTGNGTTAFTGTYSLNPDGTGSINLNFPGKTFGPAFSFVMTDGGSQLLLLGTTLEAFDVVFGTARLQ